MRKPPGKPTLNLTRAAARRNCQKGTLYSVFFFLTKSIKNIIPGTKANPIRIKLIGIADSFSLAALYAFSVNNMLIAIAGERLLFIMWQKAAGYTDPVRSVRKVRRAFIAIQNAHISPIPTKGKPG